MLQHVTLILISLRLRKLRKMVPRIEHVDKYYFQGRWKYFQVGGAQICDIIPTSGGLRPLLSQHTSYNTYHALYFSKSHLETA